ncbi:hypothetical protein [Deinococcus arboris]|nr:hypothetical protein [Deinococcus arboris]
MRQKQRKDTPKRRRKPLTPTEIAALIAALSGLLTGIAALLTALN